MVRRAGRADRKVAKYELLHSVRSHIGADDDAFNAIRQREDEDGIRGILLQRNVVPTAATALKTNIASLAPLVLPFTELVRLPCPAALSDAVLCTMSCLRSGSGSAPRCILSWCAQWVFSRAPRSVPGIDALRSREDAAAVFC